MRCQTLPVGLLRAMPALAVVLLLAACALPRNAVLMLGADADLDGVSSRPVPADWDGRLIRTRPEGAPNALGGSDEHSHSLAHQHAGTALPTTDLLGPLGVREVTSDATHSHDVESLSTTPAMTASAASLPPSYGLTARILERSRRRPFTGLVVGYIGADLPEGWFWCDGQNGAPDLRDRYIMLGGAGGPMGSADHVHDAQHRHEWATAENRDHPTYFGDPSVPSGPTLRAAARVHRHAPAPETRSEGATSAVANAPPALGVRFIMAGPGARRLPAGAVMPFAGPHAPAGWRTLDGGAAGAAMDRLLKADDPGGEAFRLSGTTAHEHVLHSIHEFMLRPGATEAGVDRIGSGPQVPIATHGHAVRIDQETRTGAAEALPRYVSLLLIIKN
jgi:hypothetical protein